MKVFNNSRPRIRGTPVGLWPPKDFIGKNENLGDLWHHRGGWVASCVSSAEGGEGEGERENSSLGSDYSDINKEYS